MMSGFFDKSSQYQTLFWMGCISNLLTLVLMLLFWKHLEHKSQKNLTGNTVIVYSGLALLTLMLMACLKYSSIGNHLVIAVSTITLGSILTMSFKQRSEIDKQKIRAFLVLAVTSIIFWMIYFTGPMGITLFIKNNVDRQIGSWTVATQWIGNINSMIIIFGSPLTAILIDKLKAKGYQVTITRQFFTAFLLLALSFLCLSLGILTSNALGYTSLYWLVFHIVFQALGELLIGPVGYAMIGKIAPRHLQGLLMGTWMMVSGVAAALSHSFSNLMVKTNATNPLLTNSDYYHVFNQLGAWAIVGAVVLFAVSTMLNRQIEEQPKQVAV